MGEKLSAFISFYSLKAKEEVEKWKTKTTEDGVKWKKLTEELYPAALKTATDLKQVETFQQVFPSPGTFVENITKYGTLLGVDTEFEKQLKELYKWRNTKSQIENRKKYLAQAEGYASKGGEDYLTRLVKEISSKLVGTTLAVALFKSYPDYVEYIEDLIDDVPGPGGVLTKPETYDALLEKKEAGAFPAGTDSVSGANVTGAKSPTETSSSSTLNESQQSTKPTDSAKTGGMSASSINSSTDKKEGSLTETKSPINTAAPSKSETTSTTSLEGGVTSKTGELQKENILEPTPSQAVTINLESKPTESKPATGPTSNSTTATTTSNSTTVNDVNSTSSVTSNPSNTSTNTGVTGDKNIMKVENTTNQSSSSTVNEDKPKKEKGGFLSKVGNFAKKAGAALNLPSVGELGEQAKGLFGAAGANIGSRISEVKNSFSINSRDEESNSAPTSSTSTNSVNSSNTTTTTKPNDILAVPNTGTTSNTSDILKTETQTAINVEQNKPAVTATASPVTASNVPAATPAQSAVSNTTNSQNTSSPTTTTSNTSQNTQPAGQPAGSPAGVGVNVDMNQLAQSITRLERILISGIEVTIKDT